MDIFNELIISVVGGVATAVILSIFGGGRRQAAQVVAAPAARGKPERPARQQGSFGHFLRLLLSVAGGVAFSIYGGRFLFQNGILERSPMMRLALLSGAIVVIWLLLQSMRRK